MAASNVWLSTLFKLSYWFQLEVSKWWQNYPFNVSVYFVIYFDVNYNMFICDGLIKLACESQLTEILFKLIIILLRQNFWLLLLLEL